MSLTPCRFFALGNCRYGNNCRFYHEPRNQQPGGFFGNRPLAPAAFHPHATGTFQPPSPATFQPQGQSHFQSQAPIHFQQQAPNTFQQQAPNTFQPQATYQSQAPSAFQQQQVANLTAKSNQNMDAIVDQVKKDMQEWQIGHIWPYSCYAPTGGKPCVPGFEDVSPEEHRFAFQQFGQVPPDFIHRLQQIDQLRASYQQTNYENRAILERVIKDVSTGATQQPLFGGQTMGAQPQQASIFGGGTPSQQPASVFGGGLSAQQQPTSIFGNSSFGGAAGTQVAQPAGGGLFQSQAPAPQNIFATQTPNQTQSAFGAPPSGLFQLPQQQTSLFQQPTAQAPPTGLFQQVQPQPNQLQGSLFQQPLAVSGAPIFQPSQPPAGLFQQAPAQTDSVSFNSANPQSGFVPVSGSIFGGSTIQQPTTNIFGGSGPAFGLAQGGGQQLQSQMGLQKFVYSDEADLSIHDIEAFKAVEFSIDSLPIVLPPQSLCQ